MAPCAITRYPEGRARARPRADPRFVSLRWSIRPHRRGITNGVAVMVPARSIEGLEKATAEQLAEVERLGETGLRWESLDVDFTIAGLMNGIFGTSKVMDAQRRGGQSRSAAKIEASRANGAKAGRPRKISQGRYAWSLRPGLRRARTLATRITPPYWPGTGTPPEKNEVSIPIYRRQQSLPNPLVGLARLLRRVLRVSTISASCRFANSTFKERTFPVSCRYMLPPSRRTACAHSLRPRSGRR